MKCHFCGTELDENQVFCPMCGHKSTDYKTDIEIIKEICEDLSLEELLALSDDVESQTELLNQDIYSEPVFSDGVLSEVLKRINDTKSDQLDRPSISSISLEDGIDDGKETTVIASDGFDQALFDLVDLYDLSSDEPYAHFKATGDVEETPVHDHLAEANEFLDDACMVPEKDNDEKSEQFNQYLVEWEADWDDSEPDTFRPSGHRIDQYGQIAGHDKAYAHDPKAVYREIFAPPVKASKKSSWRILTVAWVFIIAALIGALCWFSDFWSPDWHLVFTGYSVLPIGLLFIVIGLLLTQVRRINRFLIVGAILLTVAVLCFKYRIVAIVAGCLVLIKILFELVFWAVDYFRELRLLNKEADSIDSVINAIKGSEDEKTDNMDIPAPTPADVFSLGEAETEESESEIVILKRQLVLANEEIERLKEENRLNNELKKNQMKIIKNLVGFDSEMVNQVISMLESCAGADEEMSDQIAENIRLLVNRDHEKLIYQKKESMLKDAFGDIYGMLCDDSKSFLVSAALILDKLGKQQENCDFSSVCILASKAVELEVKKRYFLQYRDYLLETCGQMFSSWPYVMRTGNAMKENCTMGDFRFIMGEAVGTKDFHPDRTRDMFVKYAKLCQIKENLIGAGIEEILKNQCNMIEEIRIKYRNPSAHTESMDSSDAKVCLDMILYKEAYLKNIMSYFRA